MTGLKLIVEPYVGKREDIIEEVDKDRRGSRRRKTKEGQQQNRLTAAAAGVRSTGPVDRPQ